MQALAVRMIGKRDEPPTSVLVDDDDYERLRGHFWAFANKTGKGVPVRSEHVGGGRKRVRTLARDVMGLGVGDPRRVLRVDTRGWDFRKANLRIVERA